MEDLKQLMETIDANVDSFPEGEYLKMCNNMRSIFRFVKNPYGEESESDSEIDEVDLTYAVSDTETEEEWVSDPPVYTTDARGRVLETDPLDHPLVTVAREPFQPILPGTEVVERPSTQQMIDENELERTRIHHEYTLVDDKLIHATRILKKLKLRCYVTAWVKCEAVREFCESRMLHVYDYTLQAVTAKYPQYTFSDERSFFNEYLGRLNESVREQEFYISCEIDSLIERRERCFERYRQCQ